MTVHFIGVGPGDPELLTIKAVKLIKKSPVIIYAGSLIPSEIINIATLAIKIVDSSSLTLEEISDLFVWANNNKYDVARLQSGDLSIYSAVNEQIQFLNSQNIEWDMTPGVPSFAAASAALGHEFTHAGVTQTIILSRVSGRASQVPDDEQLTALAKHKCTLILHLSITALANIVKDLTPILGNNFPVAVAYCLGWPNELIIKSDLENIRSLVKKHKLSRQALVIIGKVIDNSSTYNTRSQLYNSKHKHLFREAS